MRSISVSSWVIAIISFSVLFFSFFVFYQETKEIISSITAAILSAVLVWGVMIVLRCWFEFSNNDVFTLKEDLNVRLIKKTCLLLSLACIGLSSLEAKSLEFLFDHTTETNFFFTASVPNETQESISAHTPLSSPYFQKLKIENTGDKPLISFLPYANQPIFTTLQGLAHKLAGENYPLLALYHFWDQALIRDEGIPETDCDPLDLLNLQGGCCKKTFEIQFIKLCNALGIQTRLANAHGKTLYDFSCEVGEWNFLDLSKEQLYLGLDNQTLVSSEEVMDDPFLALRTKYSRSANQVDFKQTWQELAQFEIIEPASACPYFFTRGTTRL